MELQSNNPDVIGLNKEGCRSVEEITASISSRVLAPHSSLRTVENACSRTSTAADIQKP